jgi:hypothetical protein
VSHRSHPVVAALTFGLVAPFLGGAPSVAHACTGCFAGNDANRVAYIVTFVILTVLPLACIGGALYFITKRVAEAEAKERLETSVSEPSTSRS